MPICKVTGNIRETKVDPLELAWCSGFFDGEGHVGIFCYEDINPTLFFQVTQKGKSQLIRFRKAVFGIGGITTNAIGVSVLRSNKFEDVQAVMGMLWSRLGIVKRNQFKKAISKYRERYNPNLLRESYYLRGEKTRLRYEAR